VSSVGTTDAAHLDLRGPVLVVEDEADTRAALADSLGELGYSAVLASCAEEALERLGSGDFGALLTDVRMPGMDGLELCRRVSTDGPHLPVVVMTAFGDVDAAIAALRAGAADFVTKPFTLALLSQAVERALSRGSLSPQIRRLEPAGRESCRPSGGEMSEAVLDQIALAASLHTSALATEPLNGSGSSAPETTDLTEVERRYIVFVLRAVEGNKALAARKLGIDRVTLYRKLRRHGLEPDAR
jgi:DNA-binding NtrC family response regulator